MTSWLVVEPDRPPMLAGLLACSVALVSGIAVVGWLVDAPTLTSVIPGGPTMKVNTALATVMGAGALWFAAHGAAGRRRRLRDGLAAAVLLLAGVMLAQNLFGVNVGIDEILVSDPHTVTGAPGRMSAMTAAGLVAFGAAVLLLDSAGRRARAVTLLALAVVLLGLLVAVSYAGGRPEALTMLGLLPALPTGFCFAALGIGLVLARPERESVALLTAGRPAAALVLRLVPLIVLGPVVLATALAVGQHSGLYDTGMVLVLTIVALPLLLARLVSVAAGHVDAVDAIRERVLAQAQAIGGIGSWEWDPVSGERRWSAEQYRLHGADPAAGLPPQESYVLRVHPDDRAALRVAMARNLQRRAAFAEEYRIQHPTRGIRTLLLRGDFLEAEPDAGRPARLAGTCQDVTDERAAQSALRAAEERFRCSFDEALIGMMIIGLDGRYERVNSAFCAIVGYTQEQLADLSGTRITHPEDVAAQAAAVRSLLDGEASSHVCEKRYLHSSGHVVWATINLTLIRDVHDRPVHFIAQVQDITERRSYERRLQHMADHDPLTALLNRRSFERELNSHVACVQRYGASGAVLIVDLDNFKYFNDTQGHNAGDQLIVRIAQGLQSRLRDSDVLARLGGDEFAVLLPREDEQETQNVAEALAHDGFQLIAQPIVPLSVQGPPQYELLLRLRDGHGDLIAPGSFLGVAERLGLIRQIDHWVANRAIDMLAEQCAAGRDLRFEVNLSGHTIGDEGLLELIESRLRDTGVAPERLIFEVTETAAIVHIARATAFAERLSELGCPFALDDFGAGFGSFYYLKHLPFDYLKIDGEFVRHCAENETDRILISAVVQIARGMGKRTIAEFVDRQETVEVLTGLGVDYGQGFHLGRPAPLAEHLGAP